MRKYIGYLPLVIITCLMVNCIYVVNTTNIVFQTKHYVGLIAIVVSIDMIFFNPIGSKWATVLGLIAATFNFAAFTPIIDFLTIGGSVEGKGADIEIQHYSLLLLLLFIFLNLEFIKSLFKRRSQTN